MEGPERGDRCAQLSVMTNALVINSQVPLESAVFFSSGRSSRERYYRPSRPLDSSDRYGIGTYLVVQVTPISYGASSTTWKHVGAINRISTLVKRICQITINGAVAMYGILVCRYVGR